MSELRFVKYHGLGNDFVVVDLRADTDSHVAREVQDPAAVRAICDRAFGVGADGVLPILPAQSAGADARMRVLNADGSEAEMCGNGLRCVVKHLLGRDSGLSARDSLVIDTGAGALACSATREGGEVTDVQVNMGPAIMKRGQIPMTGPADERCIETPLSVDGRELLLTAVSMGNPHAIAFVDDTGPALRTLAESVGPAIENHDWFPNRTNVEFARTAGDNHIELVVWERGCGITLACGTGACATAVAACITGRAPAGAPITVSLLGGDLTIEVREDLSAVMMTGPAQRVFEGTLSLPLPARPA